MPLWLGLFLSFSAHANELTVEKRTVRMGESFVITVSLEGAFASIPDIKVPVKNAVITGGPLVSSQFSWINGEMARHKELRFTAVPQMPGAAFVGPLVLTTRDGQQDVLPVISLEVVPDLTTASNDPVTIIGELLATGRDPLFVVAELDRPEVYAGEQAVVTWTLYNGASVQEWQIGRVPKLEDFWTEELDVRNAQPVSVVVGGYVMQKLPIRRVAIFPLRTGRLPILGVQVEAAVMRRRMSGPFGMFEGNLVETSYTSSPLALDVKPLPAGVSADVIGPVTMQCSAPVQKSGGPVVMNIRMSGRANLRSAPQPRLEGAVDGETRIESAAVSVERKGEGATMTRQWRLLVFPARTGILTVPEVTARAFDPITARVRPLRCDASTLNVNAATAIPVDARPPQVEGSRLRRIGPWMLAIPGTVILLLLAVPQWRRRRILNREIRSLLAEESPDAIRAALDERLKQRRLDPDALFAEASERGDAYRAVRSLLKVQDVDPYLREGTRAELAKRLRDLLESR